jgi:hypothetical protein
MLSSAHLLGTALGVPDFNDEADEEEDQEEEDEEEGASGDDGEERERGDGRRTKTGQC